MNTNKTEIEAIRARLAALGFKNTKAIGLNILPFEKDQTLIVKITSDFQDFVKKDGKIMKYLTVTDLETGEEGNIWAGGQLVYQLRQMKDGFIGGVFAITYLGMNDVDGEDMHQYNIKAVN